MMRVWTAEEDEQLIVYGAQVGDHEFVGQHDLGLDAGEATARMAWLREHRSETVVYLETWALTDG